MSEFAPAAGGYSAPLDSVFPPEKERVDPPRRRPKHEFELEDRRSVDSRRFAAFVIDSLLMAAVAGVMVLGFGFGPWLYLVHPAVALSYFFVAEALTGQTLGKRMMKLRVMRITGGPAGTTAVNGRTVLRLVDNHILIGLLTLLLSGKRRQRLGDLVTGTIVRPDDRPYTPPRRSVMLPLYPIMWIGAAVLICLELGLIGVHDPPMHSKLTSDPYMRRVNDICKRHVVYGANMRQQPSFQEAVRSIEVEFGAIASLPKPPRGSRAAYTKVMAIERSGVRRLHKLEATIAAGNVRGARAQLESLRGFANRAEKRFRKLGLPYCAQ